MPVHFCNTKIVFGSGMFGTCCFSKVRICIYVQLLLLLLPVAATAVTPVLLMCISNICNYEL